MKKVISLFIVSFFFVTCYSQNDPNSANEKILMLLNPEILSDNAVGIYNSSNTDVNVLIIYDDSNIDTVKISKEEVWYSDVLNENPIIEIKTDSTKLTYSLIIGYGYKLFWNKNKERWDLLKIKKSEYE